MPPDTPTLMEYEVEVTQTHKGFWYINATSAQEAVEKARAIIKETDDLIGLASAKIVFHAVSGDCSETAFLEEDTTP